ncbi:MAG TPA: response regulator [Candidatus Margulisiibacteriota bacterium]|nr:response regulator [Candidatus Margulisiibacteriota bacterium]
MAKKILVVDDEPDLLKAVVFRLKKSGYDIIEATDGQKAMDLVQEDRPHLILLDLRLPIIDGWEVCRRIKGDEELKNIPIIILTASAGAINSETTRELMAEDLLVKPFEPDLLLEKIRKYIG